MNGEIIAKGSIFALVAILLTKVCSYGFKIAMARMLGAELFGLVGVIEAIEEMAVFFIIMGIPIAIARFVSAEKMPGVYLNSSLKYLGIVGLFGFFLLFSFAGIFSSYVNDPKVLWPLRILALVLPIACLIASFRGVFQGLERIELLASTQIFEKFLKLILAIILVWLGLEVVGVAIAIVLAYIFALFLAVILAFRVLHLKLEKPNFGIFKKMFKFSLPVAIAIAASIILLNTDILCIKLLKLANTQIGYYAAAVPIARLPIMFGMATAVALLPAVAKARPTKVKEYSTRSLKFVIILALPLALGLASVSKLVLDLFFGSPFIPGASVLQILCAGMLFLAITTLCNSIFQARGKPGIPAKILTLFASLNLGLNLLLIPIYGIVGAALATTISSFLAMVSILALTKLEKIKLLFVSIKSFFSATIMSLFLVFTTLESLYLLVTLPFGIMIYFCLFTLIKGFDKRDLEIIQSIAKMAKLEKVSALLFKLARYR